jgi:serine/threonine-protein kinase RsbW
LIALEATMSAARMRLELSSRGENVPLVRQALNGLADATGLAAGDLSDISTAVTEACNNASIHAYGDGEGPLEVELLATDETIAVTVRDRGVGLELHEPLEFPTDVQRELAGVGMPSIQSLASSVRWSEPEGGGTSVEMTFAGGLREPPDAGVDGDVSVPAAIEPAQLANAIETLLAPLAVARGVLARLLRAMAARANFSVERHAEVQRVGTLVLAQERNWASAHGVQARVVAGGDFVELAIGPIADGDYRELVDAVRSVEPELHTAEADVGGERRLLLRFARSR